MEPGRPQLKGEGGSSPCYSCGSTNHMALECYFKEAICHNCGKKGHVARAGRSRSNIPLSQLKVHKSASNSKQQARKTHHIYSTQQEEDDSEYTQYALFTISVSPNGLEIEMEVDMEHHYQLLAKPLSVISKTTYLNLWQS